MTRMDTDKNRLYRLGGATCSCIYLVNRSISFIRVPPWLTAYNSWRVGRNRISLMSTSSGWLMAKATARANESAGIATSS